MVTLLQVAPGEQGEEASQAIPNAAEDEEHRLQHAETITVS